LLQQCTSAGHETAGFYIGSGSADWTILDCSSGAGDGARIDVDNANVWSNFTFDNIIYKGFTFTGTGTQSFNLFKVTGAIEVLLLHAHVDTIIGNSTDAYLDIRDDDGGVDTISKTTGTTLTALPVGSVVIRAEKFDKELEVNDASTAWAEAEVNVKKQSFRCGQKGDGTDTYIRFTHTSSDNPPAGELHFHCQWLPLTDSGFLEAV